MIEKIMEAVASVFFAAIFGLSAFLSVVALYLKLSGSRR